MIEQFPSETAHRTALVTPEPTTVTVSRADWERLTNEAEQGRTLGKVRVVDIVETLSNCLDYLDDRADVRDDPLGYGAVRPNAAMSLGGEVRRLLGRLGHEQ